ncbi:hypothetical protein DNTS_024649 [Danionella cerebrum]|uniref:CWH43-like N-terminal domain-containing protein n=1 Tax=Danionella cerebrum TaxID=2873325 RepID=A0A553NHV5_9TELE|nr:hypothetical protein DNTS_024649 [Danionella translucida]
MCVRSVCISRDAGMWWFQRGLCLLPVALVLWSSATFLVSYTTAGLLGHADLLLPYISDTGTEVPERCVFGFMLSVTAFLGLSSMYVRYKQVQALISVSESGLQLLNFSALLTGTGMSYRMQPRFHGRGILWARMTVGTWALLSLITLCSVFVSSVFMYDELPGVDVANKLHWRPGDRGFAAHQVSAAAEWSLAFSFICFFITYIRDFQPVLQSSHLYDYPLYEEREHVQREEHSPLLTGTI